MRFEFSAGGIVYRKEGSKTLILVAQHSQHHGWVFPKGIIGDKKKGEKKEETAVREVEEETGVIGKIINEFEPVIYWFVFKGERIKKTVYYFLMEYKGGDISKHDWEMESVEWVPANEVQNRLSYPSDKKVWQVALRVINRRLKAN